MEHLYFISFFVGVVISTVAMLTGIGGGVLWTPFLIVLMKIPPGEAVATALIIQVAGMGSGTVQYVRTGRVELRLAALYSLIAIPMAIFGSYAGERVPGSILKLALGIVSMVIALLFITGDDWYGEQKRRGVGMKEALKPKYSYVPVLGPFLSGMLSIGLGDFLVPMMVKRLRLSMDVAIGTAVVIMLVIVSISAGSHILFGGGASLKILMWAIPGVLLGGYIGPRISSRLDEVYLREIFIFLLLFIGIHLVYTSL